MPRIHLVSDLHTDRGQGDTGAYHHPAPPGTDIVVIAGDIRDGGKKAERGLRWAATHYAGLPIVAVAGNHCLWGTRIPRVYEKLRAAAADLGLTYLENESAIVVGVRFLGCTLWTDLASGPSGMGEHWAREDAYDYKYIDVQPTHRNLRPSDTIMYHRHSLAWLQRALAVPFEGPTVVVTHHAPTLRALTPAAAEHRARACDASDLEHVVRASGAAAWCFGHTHVHFDEMVGTTRLVSNARGYVFEPNEQFDPSFLIDV